MNSSSDDGIVVVMTADEYLTGPECHQRRELVRGIVREPPAPFFCHQAVVGRVFALLDAHVRAGGLGVVCVSPADVVLDEANALVVQPDVFFISNERRHIIRDQVWGAPDLAVEVTSPGTRRYDATAKLDIYRQYGVREYWLVDPATRVVTVVDLERPCTEGIRKVRQDEQVQSTVLPAFTHAATELFA